MSFVIITSVSRHKGHTMIKSSVKTRRSGNIFDVSAVANVCLKTSSNCFMTSQLSSSFNSARYFQYFSESAPENQLLAAFNHVHFILLFYYFHIFNRFA